MKGKRIIWGASMLIVVVLVGVVCTMMYQRAARQTRLQACMTAYIELIERIPWDDKGYMTREDDQNYRACNKAFKKAVQREDVDKAKEACTELENWIDEVEKSVKENKAKEEEEKAAYAQKLKDDYVGLWSCYVQTGYNVSINKIVDGRVYGQIRYNYGSSAGFAWLDGVELNEGAVETVLIGNFVTELDYEPYKDVEVRFEEGSIIIDGHTLERGSTDDTIILEDGNYDA